MRGRKPRPVSVATTDFPVLRLIAREGQLLPYAGRRARILLAVTGGERVQVVARREGCDAATVWRTCRLYELAGLTGLLADGRRGRGPSSDAAGLVAAEEDRG
jgi:hypothetical protein